MQDSLAPLVEDSARRVPASLVGMAASVAAVVATLGAPSWLAARLDATASGPSAPVDTPVVQAPGSRTWVALRCPRTTTLSCPVPAALGLSGEPYTHLAGRQQLVSAHDLSSRTLRWSVSPAHGRRWVLVGAEGASSASQLSVRIGQAAPAPLPTGNLTLLPLPARAPRVDVTVTEYGRPSGGEVLRIEQYAARE